MQRHKNSGEVCAQQATPFRLFLVNPPRFQLCLGAMQRVDTNSLLLAARNAKRILVVDLGFLGDTVHLVPALWELKRHFPSAALHVVSAPVGVEVLRLAPCVDRAWPLVLDPARRNLPEQWQLVRALRRERFDVAFNFSGADRATLLTALSGARYRVGHPGGRQHFWHPWVVGHWVPRRPENMPVFEQRRQILAACGLALESPRWNLSIPDSAARTAVSLIPSNAIHFSISASTFFKEWPLESWIELAKRLLAEVAGLRIVATGSDNPRERERLQAFASGVGDPGAVVLQPGLAIADLAAVLRRCRLHIGADSGVLHLALAVGTPTLSLFRDYHDASAWMPVGNGHTVLKVPCQCVNRKDPPCAALGRAECMAKLAVAEVATATNNLLFRQGNHP